MNGMSVNASDATHVNFSNVPDSSLARGTVYEISLDGLWQHNSGSWTHLWTLSPEAKRLLAGMSFVFPSQPRYFTLV